MTPLPEIRQTRKLIEDVENDPLSRDLTRYLDANVQGLIHTKHGELFKNVHGSYGKDGFELPTKTSLHMPSVTRVSYSPGFHSLSRVDNLSPVTPFNVDNGSRRVLSTLGISMEIDSYKVRMRQIKSGETIALSSMYEDRVDNKVQALVGGLMLLDQGAWKECKESGLVFIKVNQDLLRRPDKTWLGIVAMPNHEGTLEVLDHKGSVAYEKEKRWEKIGSPVALFWY